MSFADPAFQDTWNAVEGTVPNFWGPLATARDGQQEAYKEAPGGQRLVQYFDKARMELTIPALPRVSTGLLTIELKTGQMQTGDATFETRQPAKVGLVGDPGSSGPTYQDLAQVPEKDGRPDRTPPPYSFNDGMIRQAQNLPARAATISFDRLYYKLDDPSGKYSQFVFRPFWDFIQSLPLPISQTTGYAVSPLIWVHATVGGKPTEVLVQAFERRVLTWNESNDPGHEVEFGNIGQHYYTWRYSTPVSAVVPAPTPTPVTPTPTAVSSAPPRVMVTTMIVDLTSPIARNAQASMTVQTAPGASCSISVMYKSGPSNAQGLEAKTANGTGIVSWAWKIGSDTTPGTWPVTVACTANGQYTTSSRTIVVT